MSVDLQGISIMNITAKNINDTMLEYIRLCEENCRDNDDDDDASRRSVENHGVDYFSDLCGEYRRHRGDDFFLDSVEDLKLAFLHSQGDISRNQATSIHDFIYEIFLTFIENSKIFKNGAFRRIVFDDPEMEEDDREKTFKKIKDIIVRADNPAFDINRPILTDDDLVAYNQTYGRLKQDTLLKLECLDQVLFEVFEQDRRSASSASSVRSVSSDADTMQHSGYFTGSSNSRTAQRPYNRNPPSLNSSISSIGSQSLNESLDSRTTEEPYYEREERDSMSSLISNGSAGYGGKITKRRKMFFKKTLKRKRKGKKTKRGKKSKQKLSNKKLYKKEGTYISPENKYITATIDIQAIKHNIDFLRNITGTELMPVVKADAYGHGLIEMSRILRSLGIKYLGVATLGEAILLRNSGDNGRILGWLYNVDGKELIEAFNLDIDVAIFDEKIIPKFTSLIPKNKKVKVTMFVDTGINRAGINYEKAMQAFKDVVKYKNIDLVGMMSHLVCSGIKNSPIIHEQLRKFRELRKNLEEIGIRPPLVHIANTGGCMNYDVSDFTISRPGGGIYGIAPDFKYDARLKLSMTITSKIIQVKEIEKGSGIGYGWKYIAPQKMMICIILIGYADIIPRNASFKLNVYINGTKRKVLGRISMDQIVVESNKTDKVNDSVFIFGNKENCPQTIYDISGIADSIPSEILTKIGDRVNRVYV